MTEWTIITVIIAMLGFAVTVLALAGKITKPIERLNSSIITLSTKFDDLTDRINREDGGNKEAHEEMRGKINDHDTKLSDHETRIQIIEKR